MGQKQIVLCDTNIIIEFYKNNKTIVLELKKIGREYIAISQITAGELIYGTLNKTELIKIRKDIKSLLQLNINEHIFMLYVML